LLAEDFDLQTERLQRLDPSGEFRRIEHIGGLGHQIAAERDGVGQGL
jgi:hypothetical protein